MKVEDVKQITNKALEELAAALEQGHSDTLTAYLKTMSRFSKYSLNNFFLIARQQPDACRVAGYHTWRKLGRYVRKGEKGIAIVAPVVRRKSLEQITELTENETVIAGFKIAHVFSEKQTEGEPLPELGAVRGDPSGYWDRLATFVRGLGIAIAYSDEIAPAMGTATERKITLLPGQTPAELLATLAHETAHAMMHFSERRANTTKRIRETEAEAVAFVVCHAIGLDTGTSSADYIGLHAGDAKLLAESLEHIQQTANRILTAIAPEKSATPD